MWIEEGSVEWGYIPLFSLVFILIISVLYLDEMCDSCRCWIMFAVRLMGGYYFYPFFLKAIFDKCHYPKSGLN